MVKIIGISGKKQSGKNTVANYINGSILLNKQMIQDFFINEDGQLAIKTTDENGTEGFGIFDITRKDDKFVEYANRELWPYIKTYHFADLLKNISIHLFGLNPQNVYGTDDDKNKETELLWENVPTKEKKTGTITNREFLEYFGTKIVRKIKPNAWVEATMNNIVRENSEIAVIPDVRFPNEVNAIKEAGGKVIRLTRNVHDSKIDCETALDENNFDWSLFDSVIDNSNASIEDLCSSVENLKQYWN
jgi:hypothetical protein